MNDAIHILFFETWWAWDRPANVPYGVTDYSCRTFNFIEAAAWFLFAGLVLRRWMIHQQSRLELWYVLAFAFFGVSDVIETWKLTSWLLWWKGINLVILFSLRRTIIRLYYPQAKLY